MSSPSSGTMARLRQVLRGASHDQPGVPPSSASGPESLSHEVADLRARVAHLEQLIQGLQDSVHRRSQGQDMRLSEIEKRLDPAMIAAALSQDARERGL